MTNIERILKKRKWKGTDLGRLELANAGIAWEDARSRGVPFGKGAVTSKRFVAMLETLTDPKEIQAYNGYRSIFRWIIETAQAAQVQEQQANLRFIKCDFTVLSLTASEKVLASIDSNTAGMTEENRKALKEAVKKDMDEMTFDYYLPGYEQRDAFTGMAVSDRNTLLRSLYFLYGYNKLLDMMAREFGVEELAAFKISTSLLEEYVEDLNGEIFDLYHFVKNNEKNEELKKLKIEVIKEYFRPIDVRQLYPPKQKVAQAKKDIRGFDGFQKRATDPYVTMCVLDNDAVIKEEMEIDWENRMIK